ncbi:MAG: hypothetical protein ACLR5H_10050 [Oscillospiraceae bacterium]
MLHAMTHGGQRTEQEAADRLGTILDTIRRMEGSLSYALLMACLRIVHCPGVHPAVRFLIAKELPQPRGSSLFAQETVVFARLV